MQTMTVYEPRQTNSAVSSKGQSGISQLMEKIGQGGAEKGERTEDSEGNHFISMLKSGVAALREAKDRDVGKGENLEQKQMTNDGARVSAEKIDERQEEGKEIPAGFLSIISLAIDNLDKAEKGSAEGMLKGAPSESGKDKAAVMESLLTALREKGIDEKDLRKILAAIKEGELKSAPFERQKGEPTLDKDSIARMLKAVPSDSNKERESKAVPLERQMGEATVQKDSAAGDGKAAVPESFLAALREKGIDEKDILKILAAFKEGELKAVQLERQMGEASVAKDLAAGMFKVTSSDSSTKKGDGSGDSSSFSGKRKAAVPESFTLSGQADLTVYGSDSRVIKPGDAKPVEGRLLVDQIVSQLPTDADKGFSRVKIALFPENLGGLDMEITIRENKVHVVLMSDRQDVRQALQGNAEQLKSSLQSQGLLVDSMDFLLRDTPRGMDGGFGGSHLSWREGNSSAQGDEREHDALASSAAILSAAARQTGEVEEGGISLFV